MSHPAVQFPPEPVPADRPRAKVLIVDDDERNAFAACQTLEDLGHELVVARSGKEALRLLLNGDFAVILLDLHMPDMDGYETARFIRGHPRTRHLPIVFVTAVFRDEAHLFQAYKAGAVDVVFDAIGGAWSPSPYGRPAVFAMGVKKLCFWVVARADVTAPPSPERDAKLVTLDLRSGEVRVKDGDPMDVAGTLVREEGR